MHYLLKTEPTAYSFADLLREKETDWTGVTNPQAVKNLAGMKKGDKLIIYHTGDEKAAVGLAQVKSVDLSNPKVPLIYITAGPAITPLRGAARRSAVRLDRTQLSYNRSLGLLAKQDATFFNGW